ncbi:hypothetical protein K435DRAFT_355144 [Dendrothele bispora CBS 962.96]|uniref:Uncharacterized protein n=1 Tax=Dendrothele bispora (strain CBS 962.96) TaxID=1314807 RepID=A0A4S8LDX8_DENBC|nr:hypothetical protein K435DRAFT_355144 [Dendrothele bispora CBS 962.96]
MSVNLFFFFLPLRLAERSIPSRELTWARHLRNQPSFVNEQLRGSGRRCGTTQMGRKLENGVVDLDSLLLRPTRLGTGKGGMTGFVKAQESLTPEESTPKAIRAKTDLELEEGRPGKPGEKKKKGRSEIFFFHLKTQLARERDMKFAEDRE